MVFIDFLNKTKKLKIFIVRMYFSRFFIIIIFIKKRNHSEKVGEEHWYCLIGGGSRIFVLTVWYCCDFWAINGLRKALYKNYIKTNQELMPHKIRLDITWSLIEENVQITHSKCSWKHQNKKTLHFKTRVYFLMVLIRRNLLFIPL